jgi:precorrin-3B synthase
MSFKVQGWCPSALHPMESADGFVVRLRPRLARLTAAQALGLAEAALTHGNGLIEITARGNLQLRGVTETSHAPLIKMLAGLTLLDGSDRDERHRNVVVTPFWTHGDGTAGLAEALSRALAAGPVLPAKFGFALDTGPRPVLGQTSADIRLERDAAGGLILRADGALMGQKVTPDTAAAEAIRLAQWFVDSGGAPDGRGRMAAHIRRQSPPLVAETAPAPALPLPGPGILPLGALVGLEFGLLRAETLANLARRPLRITPWRMLLIEGATDFPDLPGLITDPGDARLRVMACTGSPGCPQALQKTRTLARYLAASVPPGQILHVSGCAKGCAHPGVADVTLTGTPRGFGLVRHGTARHDAERVLSVDALGTENIDLFGKAL